MTGCTQNGTRAAYQPHQMSGCTRLLLLTCSGLRTRVQERDVRDTLQRRLDTSCPGRIGSMHTTHSTSAVSVAGIPTPRTCLQGGGGAGHHADFSLWQCDSGSKNSSPYLNRLSSWPTLKVEVSRTDARCAGSCRFAGAAGLVVVERSSGDS